MLYIGYYGGCAHSVFQNWTVIMMHLEIAPLAMTAMKIIERILTDASLGCALTTERGAIMADWSELPATKNISVQYLWFHVYLTVHPRASHSASATIRH